MSIKPHSEANVINQISGNETSCNNVPKTETKSNPNDLIESNKDDLLYDLTQEDIANIMNELSKEEGNNIVTPPKKFQTEIKQRPQGRNIKQNQRTKCLTEDKSRQRSYFKFKPGIIEFQLISNNKIDISCNVPLSSNIIKEIQSHGACYFSKSDSWQAFLPNYNTIYKTLSNEETALCKGYKLSPLTDFALSTLNQPDFPNTLTFKSEDKTVIKIDYSNNSTPSIDDLPKELLEQLFSFQIKGILYGIQKHCRFLLADEMGVGKTVQAISLSLLYKEDWPVLVICPSALTYLWRDELVKWRREISYQIFTSTRDTFCKGVDYYIVSYNLFVKLYDNIDKVSFKFVIVDEGHLLKNMQTKRTKYLIPFMSKAKRLIAITGIPVLLKPMDLFPLFKALRPDIFKQQKAFKDRYCFTTKGFNGLIQSEGTANIKELQFFLEKLMIRRLKEDVLVELPSKTRQIIEIPSDANLIGQIQVLLNKSYTNSKIDFKSLNQMNDIEDVTEFTQRKSQDIKSPTNFSSPSLCFHKAYSLTGVAKIEGVKEYITCLIETECPFLLYAHHLQVLDEIEAYLKLQKINYIRLDGNVPIEKRNSIVKLYQTNSSFLVALLSLSAYSSGISLTKASTVVFAELSYSSSLMIQAEDRVHRINQKNSVNIHYLYAKGTVDDVLLKEIQDKVFIKSPINTKDRVIVSNEVSLKIVDESYTTPKKQRKLDGFVTADTSNINIHAKTTIRKKTDFDSEFKGKIVFNKTMTKTETNKKKEEEEEDLSKEKTMKLDKFL